MMDRLRDLLGEAGLLTEPADTAPYGTDWRALVRGVPRAVARPASTEELAGVVRICAEARVAMVPQGGNTSMVAGATPDATGTELVVSLARMARVRDVDPLDMTITVEAGVTLRAAQLAAEAVGCRLPLSIAAEGSATIGGVLAANAGGTMTLRHGNARELTLGIEAVLPDGSVLHALRRLRKDNTGYALRHLLVGSEGTLGFIAAAVLRLVPRAEATEVAFCAVPSPAVALALFAALRRRDAAGIEAFEYMCGAGLGLVLAHVTGTVLPLAAVPEHAVLVELAGHGVRASLETVLERALEDGTVSDAALAASGAQRAAMWRLREEHAEAQRLAGASVKNDVSVPVSRVPALIERASAEVMAIVPGVRPVPFGHVGDGNVHMNFLQPEGGDPAAFLVQGPAIVDATAAVVRDLDGSFAAEHGVGRIKTGLMVAWRGGAELAAMRRIKDALDPLGLMNPGKVLP